MPIMRFCFLVDTRVGTSRFNENDMAIPTLSATSVSIDERNRSMKMCGKMGFVAMLLVGLAGCDLSADEGGILVFSHAFDFSRDQGEWIVDFSDFPANSTDSTDYEFQTAYTDRPANLGANLKSIMISGNNHSDDLFMFMKRKITGLSPNTDYAIVFDIELASNAPRGAVGIGGAPGESVYLKAGAIGLEPKPVIDQDQYVLNIDKGNQAAPGESTVTLGDIAVGSATTEYALITRTNSGSQQPFKAKTNSKGELWLIVGTDSGFEGVTTVFYTRVNIIFSTAN